MLKSLSPEFFLSFSLLSTVILNIFLTNNSYLNFPLIEIEIFNQTFIILTVVFFILLISKIEVIQENYIFITCFGSNFLKVFLLLFCILSLPIILNCFTFQKLNLFEYFIIYLFALIALMLLLNSNDLLMVYLLLELQTLAFFVLACFDRNSAFSTEAGLKYFIFGSFISALFLCGCALIYGCTGSLNFHDLFLILSFDFNINSSTFKNIIFSSFLFIFVTFLFKVGGAPFNFWVADVYEGAPLASTILFSILPKITLFTIITKIFFLFLQCFSILKTIVLFSGLFTIFLGSFLALHQKRLKRLIIYSSIAQGGFIISALSICDNVENITYIYFFIFIYIISSILIWTQFSFFYSSNKKIHNFINLSSKSVFISTISNFLKLNKIWSISFLMIFFSISGLPPLTGFLSKFLILSSIVKDNILSVNFLLILISSFSVFYYIKIIKMIFFESKSNETFIKKSFLVLLKNFFFDFECLISSFLLFLLFYLFFYPNILLLLLENAALCYFLF